MANVGIPIAEGRGEGVEMADILVGFDGGASSTRGRGDMPVYTLHYTLPYERDRIYGILVDIAPYIKTAPHTWSATNGSINSKIASVGLNHYSAILAAIPSSVASGSILPAILR